MAYAAGWTELSKAPNGMIAVVTNPQAGEPISAGRRSAYMTEEGREKIALDGVSFHEVGKDAFGKPVERQVNQENLLQCRRTAMMTNWRALRCGCLILTSVMLGGNPAFVREQESAGASATAAVISSVAITQDTTRAAVRVEGAGRLERACRANAESGAIGAGPYRSPTQRAKDVNPWSLCACARGAHGAVPS